MEEQPVYELEYIVSILYIILIVAHLAEVYTIIQRSDWALIFFLHY